MHGCSTSQDAKGPARKFAFHRLVASSGIRPGQRVTLPSSNKSINRGEWKLVVERRAESKLVALVTIASVVAAIALLGVISPSASAETYEEAAEHTSGVAHFWPMGESSGTSFEDRVGERLRNWRAASRWANRWGWSKTRLRRQPSTGPRAQRRPKSIFLAPTS